MLWRSRASCSANQKYIRSNSAPESDGLTDWAQISALLVLWHVFPRKLHFMGQLHSSSHSHLSLYAEPQILFMQWRCTIFPSSKPRWKERNRIYLNLTSTFSGNYPCFGLLQAINMIWILGPPDPGTFLSLLGWNAPPFQVQRKKAMGTSMAWFPCNFLDYKINWFPLRGGF